MPKAARQIRLRRAGEPARQQAVDLATLNIDDVVAAATSANIKTVYDVAIRLTEAKRYEEADKLYEKIMILSDDLADNGNFYVSVLYNRGSNYVHWNKPALAEPLFTAAFINNPTDPEIAMALSAVALRLHRYEIAEVWCDGVKSLSEEGSPLAIKAAEYLGRIAAERSAAQRRP